MAKAKPALTIDQVLEYVKDAPFPCSKEQLLEHARKRGAPEEVLHALKIMRPETKYDNLEDVREGLLKERQFRQG